MLPSLYPVAWDLAREYGIEHVRFSTPEWPRAWAVRALLRDSIVSVLAQVNRFRMPHAAPGFLGMGESGRLSQQYLSHMLPMLRSGQIYELMCNPGMFDLGEVKDKRLLTYHDWELERHTLRDPTLKTMLAANNIRLIGYRHLRATRDGLQARPEETSL